MPIGVTLGRKFLRGDGTLRLIVFVGAATCAALTLGGGVWLAGLL